MAFKNTDSILFYPLISILLLSFPEFSSCIAHESHNDQLPVETSHQHDTHISHTGILVSVYLKNSTNDTQFSLNDVKTMMKVVSSEFSMIMTPGVGSGAVKEDFKPNDTYWKSYSQVFAGEAAAQVNKESNTGQSLSVYLGIKVHKNEAQLDQEIELAKESAHKANTIYNETVKGFVFCGPPESDQVGLVSGKLQKLKEDVSEWKNMRVGIRQSCNVIDAETVRACDFVVCVLPKLDLLDILNIKTMVDATKASILAVNKKAEVMFDIRMSTTKQMKEKRAEIEVFAGQSNTTVWFMEAFDNPRRSESEAQMGWWTLPERSQPSDINAYEPKYPQLIPVTTRSPKTYSSVTDTSASSKSTTSVSKKPQNSATGKADKRWTGLLIVMALLVIPL